MPKKPFALTFPYVPKWKENRQRDNAEKLVFKLRDLPESKRLIEQERIYAEMKTNAPESLLKEDASQFVIAVSKTRLGIVKDLVAKHLVSFDSFLVIDADEVETPITNIDGLWEHCSDLVAELYGRLLNGPDPDELKN